MAMLTSFDQTPDFHVSRITTTLAGVSLSNISENLVRQLRRWINRIKCFYTKLFSTLQNDLAYSTQLGLVLPKMGRQIISDGIKKVAQLFPKLPKL